MKQQDYEILIEQLKAMCEGQRYMYTLLSNTSALLKQSLQDTNWVGYYLMQDGKLILGPFQGLVACEVIEVGKGVCGTAYERKATVVVPDVEEFPGHIACSSLSRSEIVVPVFSADHEVMGVLDIDSRELNNFDSIDQEYLENIVSAVASHLN